MVTISAEVEQRTKAAAAPKHLIRPEFRPILVTIKMGNHGNCDKEDHTGCNMDGILGSRLRAVWTDMNISPVLVTDKNVVTFNMSFKGRETKKKEVEWRLDNFFHYHHVMTMESLTLKRVKAS